MLAGCDLADLLSNESRALVLEIPRDRDVPASRIILGKSACQDGPDVVEVLVAIVRTVAPGCDLENHESAKTGYVDRGVLTWDLNLNGVIEQEIEASETHRAVLAIQRQPTSRNGWQTGGQHVGDEVSASDPALLVSWVLLPSQTGQQLCQLLPAQLDD